MGRATPHRPWRLVDGRRYAYLQVRGEGRISFPLSGCASDEAAAARVTLLRASVDELVVAGVAGRAQALGAALGRAADARELEEARTAIARAVEEGRAAPAAGVVTVKVFAERWLSGELHRTFPHRVKDIDQGDNRARFRDYIEPLIGSRPIAELTLEDGDRVLAALPKERSSGTRRAVAQCLSRLARLAVYPAKVLERSPFPPGFLPPIAKPKAAPFLYPAEDAKLMACTAIPLARRLAYGILAREGMRSGNLVGRPRKRDRPAVPALSWTAIDLIEGTIRLEETKSGAVLFYALTPGTVAALRVWRSATTSPFVVGRMSGLAAQLREDLVTAGVTRSELGVRTSHREWLKAHHLRATFVTLNLAAGKSEAWVRDRTGHRSLAVEERYRRAARTAAELRLGELAPLDQAIPEIAARAPFVAPSTWGG